MADPVIRLSNLISRNENRISRHPVAGGAEITEGALVAFDAGGDAINADPADPGKSLGRADQTVKNTTALGGGTDGDKFINVLRDCIVVYEGTATLVAAIQTGVGTLAFPVDGQEVTHQTGGLVNPCGRVYMAEDTGSIGARLGYSFPVAIHLHPTAVV